MPEPSPHANTVESYVALRQEIVESQKTQADFLKWKLIAVASIGALSFGLLADPKLVANGGKLLLCLVPAICAYVDLISLHVMIRIVTIGSYLKSRGDKYEEFVFAMRQKSWANPFIFEAAALHGSSVFFNLVVIGAGFAIPPSQDPWISAARSAYMISGVLGFVWTVFCWALYAWRVREVARLTNEILPASVPAPRSKK